MSNPSLQEILCCMGQPVAGNPTQYMMEKALAAAGLDWRYLTLEIAPDQLADAVRGMKAMGFRGGNFTIPHKIEVIRYLDGLSDSAELMQAVNCVHREDSRLIGDNTDGKGFVQSLREVTDPAGKRIVVLGAGGAARAIAVEAALAGAEKITIVNRTAAAGEDLAKLISERTQAGAGFVPWEGDYILDDEVDILINATSIGLGDGEARVPLDLDTLRPETVVADVIFNPPDTRLLSDAAARGCRTLDGLGMLVNQAAIGFHIWTGQEPETALMREALEEFLEI